MYVGGKNGTSMHWHMMKTIRRNYFGWNSLQLWRNCWWKSHYRSLRGDLSSAMYVFDSSIYCLISDISFDIFNEISEFHSNFDEKAWKFRCECVCLTKYLKFRKNRICIANCPWGTNRCNAFFVCESLIFRRSTIPNLKTNSTTIMRKKSKNHMTT